MINLNEGPANLLAWFSIGWLAGQLAAWGFYTARDKLRHLRRLRDRSPTVEETS
jgi:hypothetical protein